MQENLQGSAKCRAYFYAPIRVIESLETVELCDNSPTNPYICANSESTVFILPV